MTGSGGLALIGASGGCGTTTIAIAVALAVQRAGGSSVLAELDLARGDIAGLLGVPRERSIADLAEVSEDLTDTHVAAVAYPHRSGIRVLFAPPPSCGGVWTRDAVQRLLIAARAAGFVVSDISGGLSEAALGAVDQGAHPVVVAPATSAGARRAALLAEALPSDREVSLALSQIGGRREMTARAARRRTGLQVVAEVPDSPREACSLAVGRWPTARRGRLAGAIQTLAAAVLP